MCRLIFMDTSRRRSPSTLCPSIENLPDFDHVLVRQIVALQVEGDSGLLKDFSRGAPADSINVGERNFHPFASREIDSCNACHIFLLAPL